MRNSTVGLIVSLVALVGFAGSASASATIDLIWASSGTPSVTGAQATSSTMVLNVILTAGPGGSIGAGVSVDYSDLIGDYSVVAFNSFPGGPLPIPLGSPIDTGTTIQNIGAGGFPPGLGAGATFLLGTVTFNSLTGNPGTFTVTPLVAPATSDGILNGLGIDVSATSTFNSATAVVPEPGTVSLLGMGLGGLYLVGRRSSRKR